MRDLLRNNALFVGQLYKDISLAVCARDLIFFTNYNPKSELLFNNSLLELIYFLILTHLAYRVNGRKNVLYQTIIHSFESARKECASCRHLLLQNDVSHGVRRRNVALTLKRRYKYK